MKKERFEQFISQISRLFHGQTFNDEERKEIMNTVVLPCFMAIGHNFTYEEGK